MIIAIDYDETYTRDPVLWNWFIDSAQDRGHTVFCVTARHARMINDCEFTIGRLIGNDNIIPTNGLPKRDFCYGLNIIPDVWIDDAPESIVNIP